MRKKMKKRRRKLKKRQRWRLKTEGTRNEEVVFQTKIGWLRKMISRETEIAISRRRAPPSKFTAT